MSGPTRAACLLRPIVGEDARRILDWRNQPHIRAVMFTTGEIDWHEHCAWLARTVSSETSHAFIFEQEAREIGYVKLDALDATRFTWGFYVGEKDAPAGSGSRMLFLALEQAFGPLGAGSLLSQVKPENEVSLRLHEKLGFTRTDRWKDGAVGFEISCNGWQERRIALLETLFVKR